MVERSLDAVGFLRRCRVRLVTISSLPLESSDDEEEEDDDDERWICIRVDGAGTGGDT